MSTFTDHDAADRIRQSLTALSAVVREMTPTGAKPIPAHPDHFNLLARPFSETCLVCKLPGHSSANINASPRCRVALLSLIVFWEDVATHLTSLYQHSKRFHQAVQASQPTYEMRRDAGGLKGGDLEDVLVERVTRAWLKFVAHFSWIRAKANVVLAVGEVGRYEAVAAGLNGLLLGGLTLSDLYQRDIAQ
ncbi:hypothetical protein CC86DRAFT_354622 [Ophiobolus disseminans]|uniref:Uncharacterized protein n=1 Tax=Ophiobolus disseminans TaxID=1469910 RepID=A0A6A6ZTZ4_9PLEO|nr:hypothetical protein CC86DRAFT_354622 [Ophiobolus disseminans]